MKHICTLCQKRKTKVIKYYKQRHMIVLKHFGCQGLSNQCVKQILNMRQIFKMNRLSHQKYWIYKSTQNQLIIQSEYVHIEQFISPTLKQLKKPYLLQKIIIQMVQGYQIYFYTPQNIFFNQDQKILYFNPLSITGLTTILLKQSLETKQLAEIYELLDQSMFTQNINIKKVFTNKVKFKAVGMMILHLIFERRISFLFESDCREEIMTYEQIVLLVQKVKARIIEFLHYQIVQDKIKEAECVDRVNYLYCLVRIFVEDCVNLQWKQLIQLLNPCRQVRMQQQQMKRQLVSRLLYSENKYNVQRLIQLGLIKQSNDEKVVIDDDIYLSARLNRDRIKKVQQMKEIQVYKCANQILSVDEDGYNKFINQCKFNDSLNNSQYIYNSRNSQSLLETSILSKDYSFVNQSNNTYYKQQQKYQLINKMTDNLKKRSIIVNGHQIKNINPRIKLLSKYCNL